ncbi:hypothetical protein OH492_14890 [Vibrio chagasii]|nr:hypothetical protein [Vibrio chagasii]
MACSTTLPGNKQALALAKQGAYYIIDQQLEDKQTAALSTTQKEEK